MEDINNDDLELNDFECLVEIKGAENYKISGFPIKSEETIDISINDDTVHEEIDDNSKLVKKRKRKTITDNEKRIILRANERGDSIASIADVMDLSPGSVRSVIRNCDVNNSVSKEKRICQRHITISYDIEEALFEYLDQNYDVSLFDIQTFLSNKNVVVEKAALSRFLSSELITFKSTRNFQKIVDMEVVKVSRKIFVRQQCEEEWECIFCDDFSVSSWFNQSLPLISIGVAVSVYGLVHFQLKPSCFNPTAFAEFLLQVSRKLPQQPRHLILDNAIVHKATLFSILHHIYTLPAHSSFLSPMGNILRPVKRAIRRALSNNTEIASASPQRKMAIITSVVERELHKIPKDLAPHYRHTRKYFPDVLFKRDIDTDTV